ncbi:MAG: glutathione-disulfide reductase, partial [Betaproteobacteria bacterium]|nr:glutathione-disulfide reductase [Betaproteobacteria bacterium]
MVRYDYDLITIGGGSGGVRASRLAAAGGARVALIEERELGGTCVNAGCIPKKLFSYAAHFASDFTDATGYGWTVGARSFDWRRLIANKDREIARLNGVYARILETAGAEVIAARGRLVDGHTVEAGGRRMSARHILVATGSRPVVPQVPGAELAITSDQAFHLDRFPQRVIMIGGGYIAVEFASIFNGLGSQVTLVHRRAQILRGFDDDLGSVLAEEMAAHGVTLRLSSQISRIERAENALAAHLDSGEVLAADTVMYATGRAPNTGDMGLEQGGIALADNGAITVDDFFATSEPSVYAIGDAIDRMMLTPVAIAEGTALIQALFNGGPRRMDYENVPTAIFSHPNVGTVGLTEAEARARHGSVKVFKTRFRPLKATLSGSPERMFMKLVVEPGTDRVLGAHMVGEAAGEIIQGVAIALKCGATKAQFDATIGIHP